MLDIPFIVNFVLVDVCGKGFEDEVENF
jgi:hypothetical protein